MLEAVQLIINTESMGNFTMLYAMCGEWAALLLLLHVWAALLDAY